MAQNPCTMPLLDWLTDTVYKQERQGRWVVSTDDSVLVCLRLHQMNHQNLTACTQTHGKIMSQVIEQH